MKNKKRGFSLAEVLIAATIAAIIATIGFTVAKKGVARAYNMYIYAGYNAISLSVADAAGGKGYRISNCADLSTTNCQFTKYVYNLLSGRNETLAADGSLFFRTPNKIEYRIYKYGSRPVLREGDVGTDKADGTKEVIEYRIAMSVPSVKTKHNTGKQSLCMSYQPESVYKHFLIPFAGDAEDTYCNTSDQITDINQRKDLLAFYLDDGKRGRKIDNEYQRRYFRNANEVMQLVYNDAANSKPIIGAPKNGNGTQAKNIVKYINLNSRDTYQDFEKNAVPNEIIIRITDPRRI